MLNFVTLFNSYYLTRGLVLYHSLTQNCPKFHLYVVAFDNATYNYFIENPQEHLTVISLNQFEDEKLKTIKPSRTATEYCWTCTPSTVLYCLEKFQLTHCTYIDADMCFYGDPTVLIEEMGDKSVLITNHHYTALYDQSAISGKYCVQFVTFKNTKNGLTVLNWWRNACIEWCYNRVEDGKFGDQKYLDDWVQRFEGVHELSHRGGGVAPWNVQQYSFYKKGSKAYGKELKTGKEFQLIFYHYHGLRFYEKDLVLYCDTEYDLSKEVKHHFYYKYIKSLITHFNEVKKKHPEINANGVSGQAAFDVMSFSTLLKYYRLNLKAGRRNLLGFQLFRQIRNHYYFHLSRFK